jgi:talin
VNKDGITLIDNKTKEVKKELPLTQLKRWAASDKALVLDSGAHADEYITLSTKNAQEASSMLSGYIDIILKKRRTYLLTRDELTV